MIKCRECTKGMSSEAAACPHCGHPSKTSQRRHPFVRWLFRLALVPIVLVLGNNIHEPFHEFLKKYRLNNCAVDYVFHFVFPVEKIVVSDDDTVQQELQWLNAQLLKCRQESAGFQMELEKIRLRLRGRPPRRQRP